MAWAEEKSYSATCNAFCEGRQKENQKLYETMFTEAFHRNPRMITEKYICNDNIFGTIMNTQFRESNIILLIYNFT